MNRYTHKLSDSQWIDIEKPNKETLTQLSKELSLPLRPLLSCLDPEHLPKLDLFDDIQFMILRSCDPDHKPSADGIEDLTTKLAIFRTPNFILTIHRTDPAYVREVREKCTDSVSANDLVKSLVLGAVMSFDQALTDLDKKVSTFEEKIFGNRKFKTLLQQGHSLRKQAFAYKRLMQLTHELVKQISTERLMFLDNHADIKERVTRFLYYADEMLDNVTVLLNLFVALEDQKTNEASYRANEIMRVLTVFSIFFLPLNFIASIYGMNFDNMPELHHANGYHFVLTAMGLIALLIFWFVWKRGWLRKDDKDL